MCACVCVCAFLFVWKSSKQLKSFQNKYAKKKVLETATSTPTPPNCSCYQIASPSRKRKCSQSHPHRRRRRRRPWALRKTVLFAKLLSLRLQQWQSNSQSYCPELPEMISAHSCIRLSAATATPTTTPTTTVRATALDYVIYLSNLLSWKRTQKWPQSTANTTN